MDDKVNILLSGKFKTVMEVVKRHTEAEKDLAYWRGWANHLYVTEGSECPEEVEEKILRSEELRAATWWDLYYTVKEALDDRKAAN